MIKSIDELLDILTTKIIISFSFPFKILWRKNMIASLVLKNVFNWLDLVN